MSVKKIKSKILATIVVTMAVCFIGLLLNWGKASSADAIIETTLDEMMQIAAQVESTLGGALEENVEDLEIIAEYIAESNVESDEVVEFLNAQSHAKEFETLYYIDMNAVGTTLSGETQNFSESVAYNRAKDGEYHIATPRVSEKTNDVVFSIAVPIKSENTVTGVLFSEVFVENFFVATQDIRDYTGDIFIIDTSLSLVLSTSEDHAEASFIPERDLEAMGMANLEVAQKSITENLSGGFYYDYYGVDKVMVYHPIALTEWALAMNVEVDSLNDDLVAALARFSTIGDIVYWTVIVLICYMAVSQMRSNKKLTKAAYYDPLTDLPNMEKFRLEMKSTLKQDKDGRYTIAVFDIENFKAINEMFGYKVGDKVLKTVKTFGESLNIPTLMVARISGDTFGFFAKRPGLDDLMSIAGNIDAHYDKVLPELENYAGTFKVGRYNIEAGETDIDEIMSKVNLALSRAKNSKGVTFCDYDDTFKRNVQKEAEITIKAKPALENNEFKVYLQPKFSTTDDKLVGAEALVRWIEDDGTLIYPSDFIPLFERNGLIVDLDRNVLENVCKTIRRWIDEGRGALTVSINCSRLNLSNPFFVSGVIAIADKYNIPHELLEIELTESTAIESASTIEQLFEELKSNNFRISIDDFGAGYSSLGMLKNLQVDTLKMDRSFFVGGKNARRDDMLIDSIVKMSHNLGMYVVAEGIETPEQVELLKSMNCDAIQGYVHAKPMPITEFEDKYAEQMKRSAMEDLHSIPQILNINDAKFANSLVPCGILIAELKDGFRIVEANEGYFNLIGYTKEEVRDLFQNNGLETIHPDDRNETFEDQLKKAYDDPTGRYECVCRLVNKYTGYKTVQCDGRIAVNESGETRLYLSIVDISGHIESIRELKGEKDFNSRIADLTNSVFFDYDKESKTIRFSKNFADRFDIPDTIENFLESEIGRTMFSGCRDIFEGDQASVKKKREGEFYMTLPNGEPIWYLYSTRCVFDEEKKRYRTVGKMSEALAHKLEMGILKVKSESDPKTEMYNKSATERYIHNYLRIATEENDTGALFVVDLDNFSSINSTFGHDYGDKCLRDVGSKLRTMFRSSDIIGRIDEDQFYIFIGNYKEKDFVEKKAAELCGALGTTHELNEQKVEITASVGIALYPEHGDEFDKLYKKAVHALEKVKKDGKNGYVIHQDN